MMRRLLAVPLLAVGEGVATAWTRNGQDWSDKFKALVKAAAKLPAGCLIDGEAVAIGLLCALRLSGADDLRDEVAELLSSHGLPLRFEGADVDDVIRFVARDKKRRGGEVRFVLLEAPGRVTPDHAVAEGDLRAAVAEVRAG